MEREAEEKNFDEIYNAIYESSSEKLKEAKRKKNGLILKVLCVCIIINIVLFCLIEAKVIVAGTIALSFCLIMILSVVGRQSYGILYKTSVIQELIKQYNDKLYYSQKIGITQTEFRMSNFDKSFDRYHSEDRIYGTLKSGANIQVAEIATYRKEETTDSNGNKTTTETETYRGMYGIARLSKNICTKIYISDDSMFNRFSKYRVEVDSAEFEKYFDCSSEDRITAMRIFTSDLIEKYIDIMKRYKYKLELRIIDDKIFFRYKCGQLFEPPTFGDDLDKKIIKKYYDMIVYPLEIIEQTVENINYIVDEN